MNNYYPLSQHRFTANPAPILNPLAMENDLPPINGQVLAAAVRSFLTQSVEEPTETYEESGFGVLKDYPEELIYIGYTLLKAYLMDKLLSVPSVTSVVPGLEISPASFVGSIERWQDNWRNIGTSVTSKSRITKTKTGYTLSLYVGEVDVGYYKVLDLANYASTVYQKTGKYLDWETQRSLNRTLELALHKAKATVFGKDLLDLSKSADFTIKVTNPFLYVSQADFLAAEMSDEESLAAFSSAFRGFRIISPQLAGGSSASYNLYRSQDGASHYTTENIPPEEMEEYTIHSISRRSFEGFVNFVIPGDIAEYVTQSTGSKATKGKLGMWFFQWSANMIHPNGSGAFSEVINPLSNIAEINAPNESKAASKSNKHNLAIDNSGHIVYLPTVNKAKEYDAMYDSIGDAEDGDFCINDIKELPGNTAPITGPRTRSEIVSRKFPENMLIYTDWINGKLSYSNTSGVMQILDIDSYSPASPTTIRALLDTPLFGSSARTKSVLAAVTAFIRQYAPEAMYAHLQSNQWADFKEVFGDWKKDNDQQNIDDTEESAPPYYIASMVNQLMSSALPAFLENLFWRMRSISNDLERNPENNSGANATLLLDYSEEEEWTVKEFSMSSSMPILHCVGYALKMALETALSGDPDTLTDRLFMGKSVLSNMADLGITVGIAQYVNDYEGVAIQDRANRKIYMEAKRDPKYIPKPVPLVKDKYFLPHQAKNAAILDQKPKNAILSVSAGGGKTIQLIVDILHNLSDGTSKRPLVICPGFLVKNYVEDIAYFTEGRLNSIVVNSDTMRVYGEEKLRAMIKSAPPNTVVLSDYDFISRGRTSSVPYGINSINISQNAEFMREFDFDSICLDESHNLKNADSLRSQFTQRIINTIPIRRLATGTFTPNQTSDIIGQMNMLDPSIFGDLDDFIEEYSNGKIGNVFLWKDGAEKEVARRISENSALITCKRKEWQFLLPLKEEKFHFINLSDAQKSVYNAILNEEIERIKENEKLRKKLESGDENDAEAIETMLKAYLQRVERFLAAPATDELGNRLLEGDDRISPKGLEVAKLFEEHLASGDTGKILVFTSYLPSAQAIYDCLPSHLQAQTLHYTSANKANDLATFNKDPRIKFLVGVENSLKEGLNLQIASRLIRVETVWSPGALEQAESRINRPDPKNNDPSKQRAKIFLDWLIVDNTIDVTKTARLISKMIKTTKFEEQNNPIYNQVPDDLDPILMTLDNITKLNSWQDHLPEYLQGYESLKRAEKQDYNAYRATPDFSTANVPLSTGETMKDATIMPQVPYIDAMTLPFTEELGLKSFTDYVSEHGEAVDDAYKFFDAVGLRVHTEYGDGVVTSSRDVGLSVYVTLDNGNKVSVKKLKLFVIIEEKKGSVRQRLAALAGLPLRGSKKVATSPPAVVAPAAQAPDAGKKEPVPNTDTQANAQFNLYVGVVNNMASVGIDNDDPDVSASTLKKIGFDFSGPYVYCSIPNAKAMWAFIERLTSKYIVPQANLDVLEALAETFNMGRKKLLNIQQSSAIEMQNFWRIAKRPVAKGTIKPYPIVQDGILYIAFWKAGQPSVATLKAKMAGITGVTFDESDGEYFAFFPNKVQLKAFIQDLRQSGYTIGNMNEVKEQYAALTLVRRRAA